MLEFLLISNLVIGVSGFLVLITKLKRPASVPVVPALPVAAEHLLIKTWTEAANGVRPAGWRWKCSCGVMGSANNITNPTGSKPGSLGSESNAIERFETHAEGYKRVNGNEWKDKHDALQARFDEAQEKCYCKDIHTVKLLPMKG